MDGRGNIPKYKRELIEDPSQMDLYDFEPGSTFNGLTVEEVELLERCGKAKVILETPGENVRPEIFEQYLSMMEELQALEEMLQDPNQERTLRVNTEEE